MIYKAKLLKQPFSSCTQGLLGKEQGLEKAEHV